MENKQEYKGLIDRFFGTTKRFITSTIILSALSLGFIGSCTKGFQCYFNKKATGYAGFDVPLNECIKHYIQNGYNIPKRLQYSKKV